MAKLFPFFKGENYLSLNLFKTRDIFLRTLFFYFSLIDKVISTGSTVYESGILATFSNIKFRKVIT